jgi:hypothetical protein
MGSGVRLFRLRQLIVGEIDPAPSACPHDWNPEIYTMFRRLSFAAIVTFAG